MNTPLQRRGWMATILYFIIAVTAAALLSSCNRQSYCAAYSYGIEPVHKQTWKSNQKPKAAAKRTEHYNYRQKPSALVEFFTRR